MNARDTSHTGETGTRAPRGSRAWSLGAFAVVALAAGALPACGGDAAETRSSSTTAQPPFTNGSDSAAPVAPSEVNKQLVAPSMDGSGAARSSASGAPGAAPAPSTGSAAANEGGTASEPRLPSVDFLGRSIIRTGSMDLEVESVSDSFERVSAIATGAGGFVADSRFFGRTTEPTPTPRMDGREPAQATTGSLPVRGGASLTLRIPAERFDDVVAQLQGVAVEVRTISTGSQDVTGEVTDLDSTIRNLRAVETRYMEMLNSARTLNEILQVQDRLNQTRDQIERAQGRLASLQRLADLSSLTVSLTPVVAEAGGPKPAGALAPVGEAWEASLEALRSLGVALLVGAAFGWWMLPLLAVALWGASRLLRASGARRVEPLRAAPIDTPQGTA